LTFYLQARKLWAIQTRAPPTIIVTFTPRTKSSRWSFKYRLLTWQVSRLT